MAQSSDCSLLNVCCGTVQSFMGNAKFFDVLQTSEGWLTQRTCALTLLRLGVFTQAT
jgi:hypothetical protein